MSRTRTSSSWPEVEGRGEDVARLLPQPGEDLRVGAGDARRGVPQPVAVRVLADADEQLTHGGLDPRGVVRRADRGRREGRVCR